MIVWRDNYEVLKRSEDGRELRLEYRGSPLGLRGHKHHVYRITIYKDKREALVDIDADVLSSGLFDYLFKREVFEKIVEMARSASCPTEFFDVLRAVRRLGWEAGESEGEITKDDNVDEVLSELRYVSSLHVDLTEDQVKKLGIFREPVAGRLYVDSGDSYYYVGYYEFALVDDDGLLVDVVRFRSEDRAREVLEKIIDVLRS